MTEHAYPGARVRCLVDVAAVTGVVVAGTTGTVIAPNPKQLKGYDLAVRWDTDGDRRFPLVLNMRHDEVRVIEP